MSEQQVRTEEDPTGEVLELATRAGHILLENGAEISRVEETMERISTHFNVDHKSFFVLSNGIFTTGRHFAEVEYIPFKGTQLDKVVEVNQLSRDIEAGKLDLHQASQRMDQISRLPGKPFWEQLLGASVGSAGFCIIFGGSLFDAAVSFIAGLLLYFFILTVGARHLTKLFCNICGGAVASLVCLLCYQAGLGDNLSHMIIGAIIPLIPGVSFTNGIRDIAGGDYIAGTTRLLDALMVFFSIALGVSLVLLIDGRIQGAMLSLHPSVSDPLTSNFFIQLLSAFVGTLGFAVLFGVPRRHYLLCGITATAGWAVYLVMLHHGGATVVGASALATVAVALVSQYLAVIRHCPVTVFLICGIFPLIPGAGIYWTTGYIVSNQLRAALESGFTALKITVALILGIILVTELTALFYRKKRNRSVI